MDRFLRWLIAGAVIGISTPLRVFAEWCLRNWIADSSQLADRIAGPDFGLGWMPWPAMAFGLALAVLDSIWRQGAAKGRDIAGLV